MIFVFGDMDGMCDSVAVASVDSKALDHVQGYCADYLLLERAQLGELDEEGKLILTLS